MDRLFTAADAFDLAPIGRFTLGKSEFDVPPLTFGRWLRLTAFDFGQLMGSLAGLTGAMDDEEAGRALADQLSDVALLLVPGLPEADWKKHADLYTVCKLVVLFGRNHDWAYIAQASHFGEPPEEDEGPLRTVEEGLLAFDAMYPGHPIADFFDLRVEGFYRTMDAAIKRAREQNEQASGTAEPSDQMPAVKDPERYAALSALFDGAQKVDAAAPSAEGTPVE